MATVPYKGGIPQVSPADAPAPYQTARPGPGFMAGGAAMESFGAGLQKTGQNLVKIADYYDDVAADAGLNQFQEMTRKLLYGDPDIQTPGPDGQPTQDLGFLSMNGETAMRARPDVQKQIDAADKAIRSNLKSPRAQEAYDKASRTYRESAFQKISSHTDAESTKWATAVNSATGVNALTDIANDAYDPERVAKSTEDLIAARVKNLQLAGNAGDPNLLKATIEGAKADALVARVKAMAVKEPASALKLLDDNRTVVGAQYDELSASVRARAEQQIGLGAAEQAIQKSTTKAVRTQPAAQGSAPGSPAGDAPGMLSPGNIDLGARPVVKNADGTISTVRSMSFEEGGKEILIPMVGDNGKIMTDGEAVAAYRETGKHLGVFDTASNATAYAKKLHDAQANYYGSPSGGAKPDVSNVASAIHAQESGGAATAGTSVAGAVGGWQIMPRTFALYAKEGEKIDNPADNAAVGQRIVADLYAKAGGDPARVAVGYFSGEGNIAPPGSPTPWITDTKDATGKTVSSYVSDVVGRLGGTAAAPAPAPDPAAGIASMKADAYQEILDDKSLTPTARSAALAAVSQHYQVLDDRRIAEKRASDERRSAYTSTLEIEVNRGQKSYLDVENAWQNGLISDAKRTELTLNLDRQNKEKGKVIEKISRADASFNGGPRMDPRIEADRDAVDLHYQMTSASWAGLPQQEVLARAVSYAGQVGMAPTPLKTMIRGNLRSGDASSAVVAAQTVSQLRNQNPQILNDFNEEDIRLATLIGTYSGYGVPAEKAYADSVEAMKVSEPERKARRDAYDIERGADIKQRDASNRRWLEGKLNSFWTSDPTLDPIMRAEWDTLVRSEYERTANLDASRQYALDMTNRVWGRTEVGGALRYMKFSPEKFYGIPTMSPAENAEWMNEQLLGDVLKGALSDPDNPITLDRLFLTPDPTRATRDGNPVYQVSIIGADGVFRAVRGADGRALPWVPNWETSAAKRIEKGKYDAHIADLRRQRTGTDDNWLSMP